MTNPDRQTARHPRRAAAGARLAAPALAAPALAAALIAGPAAAAAPASPAPAPACHPPGHRQAGPDSRPGRGRAEALIGNLRPAPGATVPAAATISFLIADNQPFPAPASRDVTVTVNGAPVTVTAGPAETGVPVTYPGRHGTRPRPASCEIPFTFTLPADATGTVRIQVTAHDADGDHDSARWTLAIATTTMPTGAIGGIIITATAGLTLLAAQARRRRTPPARN